MLRRLLLHPLLLAAWPVVAAWSANRHEVGAGDVWPVILLVLVSTAAIWVLAALVVSGWARGAVVASVAALACQLLGRVELLAPAGAVMLAVLLVTTGLVIARRSSPDLLASATFVLNGVAVVALVVAGVPLVASLTAGPVSVSLDRPEVTPTGEPATRDVFYIVPDRYGRADTLEEVFGWDATAFTAALEDRGFQVAEDSVANYPKTAHSLAASWNLTYLDELTDVVPESRQADWRPVYGLLRDHLLGEVVTELGYEYVHVGMWWSATSRAPRADDVRNHDARSEFAQVYSETTLWPAVVGLLRGEPPRTARERVRAHTRYQLEQLRDLARASEERPRFVLAHLALPHEPYVFEPDGSWVPAEVEAARSRTENFTRQLAFTDAVLLELVDELLARPVEQRPIIVIQADEGPHPPGYLRQPRSYEWLQAPDAELREKLTILTALHLPGADVEVPPTLSPVNTFRLLLDTYHGTGLGLLEDRAYVYRDEGHLYEFHEVTERLR